jgi:predicted outer membrane repeat protein
LRSLSPTSIPLVLPQPSYVRLAFRVVGGLLLAALFVSSAASAQTYTVNTFTDTQTGTLETGGGFGPGVNSGGQLDLRGALFAAMANGGTNTINFACSAAPCTITLAAPLPPIFELSNASSFILTIDGGAEGSVILDGDSLAGQMNRVFWADNGTLTLKNLIIQNALVQGGHGAASGGGAGAGFGAGLFVNQAKVTIQNTSFLNCTAIGGTGAPNYSGGGGGGGGMTYNGANSGSAYTYGAGGGGGVAAAANSSSTGGAGGGGAGNYNLSTPTAPPGGVGYAANGAGGAGTTTSGGMGGFGGGGGGGLSAAGGAGGFGGGGGGAAFGAGSSAGSGGFGGGGGGGYSGSLPGSTAAAVGGIQGGASTGTTGGGGAAAGPAIFVFSGTVTLSNVTGSGFVATAGAAGGSDSSAGTANTAPVFNYSGTVNGSSATGPNQYAFQVSEPVGQTSATMTAVLYFATAVASGTSFTTNVLTQGVANQDFAQVSGGTCSSGTAYAVGASCTVLYTFTPKFPGQRLGTVDLVGSSNSVAATAYISGTGTGPLATFPPGLTPAALGSGFSRPYGVAVDGAGNVYVADTYNSAVKEIPYSSGVYGTPVTLGSGFSRPYGVAVDGAGNVYVADTYNSAVKEIPYSGGVYVTPVTMGSGFSNPSSVAVDGAGNVYVADTYNSAVKEIPYSGGVYGTPVTLGGGFNTPQGVAVDGAGNVYVADSGNRVVKEIPYSSGYSGTPVTLGSSFSEPVGVAVDGAGNVYVADYVVSAVDKIPYSGGVYGTLVTLGSGFSNPFSVALDGAGNVYVADPGNLVVKKIDLSTPPSLVFATATAVGTTDTTDGVENVALSNIGNMPLVFAVPGSGYNPSTNPNFTLLSTGGTACPVLGNSSTSQSLPVGGTCVLGYEFTPVTVSPPPNGNLSIAGTSVVTDNSNATTTTATQTVALSGTSTATSIQQSPDSAHSTFTVVPSIVVVGGTATLSVHFADSQGYSIAGQLVVITLSSHSAKVGGVAQQGVGQTDANGNYMSPITDSVAESVNVAVSSFPPSATRTVMFVQPSYLVTTLSDDATGSASNCVVLATDNTNGNGSCSLRDAIAATNALSVSRVISINQNVAINGPGANALTLSGNGSARIFSNAGTTVSINGLTMANGNDSSGSGGAVYTSNNSGTLTLDKDVFTGNTATSYGGGLYIDLGAVNITNSTFYNNSCGMEGGAINEGGSATALNITNSTFSGNSSSGIAGAIRTYSGSLQMTNVTMTSNTSGNTGGAVYANAGKGVTLTNTIIVGNTSTANGYADYYGDTPTLNSSLVNTGSSGISSTNPMLSALGNYGGTTPILLPEPYSPALCEGSTSVSGVTIPTSDQRGASRHVSYCPPNSADIGAVQTHYSTSFLQQPTNVAVGVVMTPAPSIQVSENGLNYTASTLTLTVTDFGGGLSSQAGATTNASTGIATYAGLVFSRAKNGDSLQATLLLSNTLPIPLTSNTFNIVATPPAVTGISPAGGLSAGGTVVTIMGTNFTSASTVAFGGTSATSVTYNSPTQLTAVSPAEAAGAVDVYVYTQNGTSTATTADMFTYYSMVPYLVTTLTDDATGVAGNCVAFATGSSNGNGNCSLRDAIAATNALSSGLSPMITFILPLPGSYPANTYNVYNSTIDINQNVSIIGPGANVLTIDGGGKEQIFAISGSNVAISGLTLAHGLGANGEGGAIFTTASLLTLNGDTLQNNTASSYGGALYVGGGATTITNSTFNNNSSGQEGGAINNGGGAGSLAITNSTFSGNTSSNDSGAIRQYAGSLSMTDVTMFNNSATNNGGAIYANAGQGVVLTNMIVAGNSGGSYADYQGDTPTIHGGIVGTSSSGTSTIAPALTGLGNYGGTTSTSIPEPGSPAICAGITSVSGVTIPATDQRGATHSGAYCSAGQMDAGALQTSYALAFTTQTSNVGVAVAMYPAPVVQLVEDGQAYTGSSPSITVTDADHSLNPSGTTMASPATFSTLTFNTVETGDTLTAAATLSIVGNSTTALSTLSGTFNVGVIPPTVTGISPAGGPLAGGTSVTISGTDFTAASTVKFGATSATSATYVSATQLTATAPAEVAGAVHIVVTTADGSSPLSSADLFTYYAAQGYLVTTLTDDATSSAANCVAGATNNSAGNSACSLRDAITAANGLDGALGTINFWSGIAGLSAATKASPVVYSVVTGGRLNITGAVTINGYTSGSGASVQDLIAVDGGGSVEVFYVNAGGNAVGINNLTIRNGSSGITVNGGTVTVSGSTVSGNTNNAFSAAGGITVNSGTAAVIGSTISANTANGPSSAGGIVVNSGLATVLGSTISGNATGRDALESAGGITLNGGSTVTVTSSTISGNTTSASGSSAGAIYMDTGTLTVVGSTISGNNTGVNQAIGGIYVQAGTATFSNSIVSGNSGGDTSGGYTDNGGNEVGVSGINLSALGYYGGLTQTMVPLPGSPAICAGLVASLSPAPGSNQAYTDQRGATHSAVYCSSAQLDAGAVQTSYALGFVQGPTAVALNTAMSPAPTVQVSEDGMSYIASSPTLTMIDLDGSLTAGGSASTGSTGLASFSGLTFGTGETSDKLTATLNVSAAGATVSTTSGTFNIGPQPQTITFPQPASPVVNGITTVMMASSTANLAITYTVSGPATVSGSTVTYTGDGTVMITASQAGNSSYTAATPVMMQVTVVGDYIWLVNANGARSKLYQAGTTEVSNATNQAISTVSAIAFDSSGDAWSVGSGANALNFASSTLQSTSTSTGGGLSAPVGVAVDGLGNVWVANSGNSTVSEFNSAGTAVTASTAYASDTLSTPGGIAIDSSGSLWVTNTGSNSVTEILGAAAPVVTPTVPAVTNSTQGARP